MVYVQSSLSLLIDKPIPPLVQFHQKPRNEAFVIDLGSVSLFGPASKLPFPFQAVISDYQNSAVLYSYAVETWWKDKVVILRKK